MAEKGDVHSKSDDESSSDQEKRDDETAEVTGNGQQSSQEASLEQGIQTNLESSSEDTGDSEDNEEDPNHLTRVEQEDPPTLHYEEGLNGEIGQTLQEQSEEFSENHSHLPNGGRLPPEENDDFPQELIFIALIIIIYSTYMHSIAH